MTSSLYDQWHRQGKVSLGCALIMVSTLCGGCDDERSSDTRSEGSLIAPLESQGWSWSQEDTEMLEVLGKLFISIEPRRSSGFAMSEAIMTDERCPRRIRIKLPLKKQLSGAISVALDQASEATSISTVGWLRIKDLRGGFSSLFNENPFSSAQLLFSLGRYYSTLYGTFIDKDVSLYIQPSALPPFLFSSIDVSRFSLSLPILSSIEEVDLSVWRDLDELAPLGRARVSLWDKEMKLSTIGETNDQGRVTIEAWGEILTQLGSSPLTIRVTPPQDSLLPTLVKSYEATELRAGDLIELSMPHLETILNVPISIDGGALNDESLVDEVWRVDIKQAWSADIEQNFSLPNDVDQRGSAAIWNRSLAIVPGVSQSLPLHPERGVIFLSPPPLSSQRTQRIELERLSEADSLRLTSRPKPLVRGQVRTQEGQAIPAEVRFTQLAWPWPDAESLALGEYSTSTDSKGSFSVAVDPGIYAVSYLPVSRELAPQISLLKVPDGEGLLISPQQASIQLGEEMELIVGGEGSAVTSVESRVKVDCLISSKNPIFIGSSLRDGVSPWRRVPLIQHLLGEREIFSFRLSETSCPPLSESGEERR